MKYMISNYGNILIEPESYNKRDMDFLLEQKPYRVGSSDRYKIPLTRQSLNNLITYYNIDYYSSTQLTQLIYDLELALNFNIFDNAVNKNIMLRPYQEQGIDWIKLRLKTAGALGLFWAPRTGKTRTACIATQEYSNIIVLSLAGQEANWETTYEYVSNRKSFNLHKLSPTKREAIYKTFNNSTGSILLGSINTMTNDIINGLFKPKDYNMLIIDEVHKAKNMKTNIYKGCKMLRAKADCCLLLTGTPVSKHINEILPLFSLAHPSKFSKTYLSEYFFNQEYNSFSDYGMAGDLRENKKQEWLEFIALYFSQVTKEQALPWAKEPLKETIRLKLGTKQRAIYEKCLLHGEINLEEDVLQIQEVIAQFTRLRQIVTHPKILSIEAPSVKEEWLLSFLANDEERDGVIIFSTHTSYLKLLYKTLIDLGYKVCMITGETKNKTLTANEFQDGLYDIVLANIQAGSKGITLDRADTMIFFDEDWRPDENQQAIERFAPTTASVAKLRKVYRLETSDVWMVDGQEIRTMDSYIHDVVCNKITQTELINNFKALFKKNCKII